MSVPPDDERGPEPGDQQAERDAHEAAWEAIVANYGDRPAWEQPGSGTSTTRPARDTPAAPSLPPDEPDEPRVAPGPDPRSGGSVREPAEREEHFVPPPPPPVPRTTPPRLAAWIGLFGVPLFALASLLVGVSLPQWLSVVLMVWFVGGFVFLVASMRPGHHDDHDDDGAVL